VATLAVMTTAPVMPVATPAVMPVATSVVGIVVVEVAGAGALWTATRRRPLIQMLGVHDGGAQRDSARDQPLHEPPPCHLAAKIALEKVVK
jgi:hypothetical protein